MPPEEMTGSTHILEFMCYAIAGSAGIRFCIVVEAEAVRRLSYVHRGFVEVVRPDDVEAVCGGLRGHGRVDIEKRRVVDTGPYEIVERVRDGRRRRAGRAERQGDQAPHGCYVQRGVESPVNPLKRRLRGYRALSAGGFAVAGGFVSAKICGVVGGPPADD